MGKLIDGLYPPQPWRNAQLYYFRGPAKEDRILIFLFLHVQAQHAVQRGGDPGNHESWSKARPMASRECSRASMFHCRRRPQHDGECVEIAGPGVHPGPTFGSATSGPTRVQQGFSNAPASANQYTSNSSLNPTRANQGPTRSNKGPARDRPGSSFALHYFALLLYVRQDHATRNAAG